MNKNLIILSVIMLMCTAFAQEIKPYPGQTVDQTPVVTQPFFPPIVSQGILVVGVILVLIVFFFLFIFVLLIILRLVFPPKSLPDSEVMKRERISDSKSWNGTLLKHLQLSGDQHSVPSSVVGFCTGFKAEGDFDYITWHSGIPWYFWLFKKIKGDSFQLHIPFIDITIPPDHIIQIEPDKHSVPGSTLLMYASGIKSAHSGYEMVNTSTTKVSKRMEIERNEIIARTHGITASHTRDMAEKFWESKPEHFKKRDAESSRVPAGK